MKPFDLRRLHESHLNTGLVYLSLDGITLLNNAVAMLHSIRNEQDRRSSRRKTSHTPEILYRLKTGTSSSFYDDAKQLCRDSRSLIFSDKLNAWESEQIAWLNDEGNWSRLIRHRSDANEPLLSLKNIWDRQKAFCLCSNDYLLQAMNSLLLVQSELILAESEFFKKQHQLPEALRKVFGQFLAELREKLNQTKTDLLNAMLTRLFVAGRKSGSMFHLRYDDVLVYTIESLQQYGALNNGMSLIGSWQTLEPKHFNAFHDHIAKSGSASQLSTLRHLPWFHESLGEIKTKNVVINNRPCIVPASMSDDLPKQKRKPNWFFHHQNRSIDFICKQQSTIANLKLGFPNIRSFEVNERFKKLDQYEQQIRSAKRKLAKEKPVVWQFWSYLGYKKLLDDYRLLLNKQSHRCLQERIKLLEEIAYQELPPRDRESKYQLWILLRKQLASLKNNIAMPYSLQRRLQSVEVSLLKNLQQDPASYANCLLQALVESEHLERDEMQYLKSFIEINALSPDKDSWLDSLTANQRQMIKQLFPSVANIETKQFELLGDTDYLSSLPLMQLSTSQLNSASMISEDEYQVVSAEMRSSSPHKLFGQSRSSNALTQASLMNSTDAKSAETKNKETKSKDTAPRPHHK